MIFNSSEASPVFLLCRSWSVSSIIENNTSTTFPAKLHSRYKFSSAVTAVFRRYSSLCLLSPELFCSFSFDALALLLQFLSSYAGIFFNSRFFLVFIELSDCINFSDFIQIKDCSNRNIIAATLCRKARQVVTEVSHCTIKVR